MPIKYSDLPIYQNDKSIKSQIIAYLLSNSGLLPAHEVVKHLQHKGILPNAGTEACYKRAKYLVYHHVRESYYLQREKGDIIRLVPTGKDDTRYWSNPFDAPDITSFIFSLLCSKWKDDLKYDQAIPYIREYIDRYEAEYHEACKGSTILYSMNGNNMFYTIKKQVKHFLEAKGYI